jgi:hypothetical protein
MKKVVWKDQNDQILFQETVENQERPRIGESVIWHKLYMKIENIEHNFDKKEITIFVEIQ